MVVVGPLFFFLSARSDAPRDDVFELLLEILEDPGLDLPPRPRDEPPLRWEEAEDGRDGLGGARVD